MLYFISFTFSNILFFIYLEKVDFFKYVLVSVNIYLFQVIFFTVLTIITLVYTIKQ